MSTASCSLRQITSDLRSVMRHTVQLPEGRRFHCEFKSGGVGPQRRDCLPIRKDLGKLLVEPGDGMWFHLLESTNNATIGSALNASPGALGSSHAGRT